MDEYIQIQWTAAHLDEARDILEVLLSSNLICCGSIIPLVESWYSWKGEIVSEQEVKVLMKTKECNYAQIEKVINKLHSYEIVEILYFTICDGNDSYLKWMDKQVKV
jgi:periplasmic divalent cation tolerance protein